MASSQQSLQRQLTTLLNNLSSVARPIGEWDQFSLTKFFQTTTALQAFLLMNASALGECREKIPYSPLKPVLENGELKWCCEHNPEHCSKP